MLHRVRFSLSCLVMVAMVMLATESEVEAQKKKPAPKKGPPPASTTEKSDPDETKDKPAIESELLKAGDYRGRLLGVPNEGGLFRVAVEYQRVRVKNGKQAEFDRLQKDIVNQAAKANDSQTKAAARAQMVRFNGRIYGGVYGSDGYFDRLEISGALGSAAGAATKVAGENVMLNACLETVSDSQTVIFHAAPTIQVRLLRPSDKPVESIPSNSPTEGKEAKKAPDKSQLPGYEGALKDLKVGQRVWMRISQEKPGSVYKRLVRALVVEEEPQVSSSSK